LDLDALVGGEVRVKLGGRVRTFYAMFSGADEAHRERIVARLAANNQRQQLAQERLRTWIAAVQEAKKAGTPPPAEPDLGEYGVTHPDFYAKDQYERDVYNLLLSVWRKSEESKPEHEREQVTPDTVRELCNPIQGWALLERLFPVRYAPRVVVPAQDVP